MRTYLGLVVGAALAMGIGSAASAQEQQETLKAKVVDAAASGATVCKNGKLTRRIEIVATTAGKKVPCEVHDKREAADKVIYKAERQEGYCEEKAKAFAEKLSGMGWTCAAE
jgi:hypothetical protein